MIFSRGFDYWESGMDLHPGHDMYESFRNYQKALLAEFDLLSHEYKFEIVDASADVKIVFAHLKTRILGVLAQDPQRADRSASVEQASVSKKPTTDAIPFDGPYEGPEKESHLVLHPVVGGFSHESRNGNGNGNGNGRGGLHT